MGFLNRGNAGSSDITGNVVQDLNGFRHSSDDGPNTAFTKLSL